MTPRAGRRIPIRGKAAAKEAAEAAEVAEAAEAAEAGHIAEAAVGAAEAGHIAEAAVEAAEARHVAEAVEAAEAAGGAKTPDAAEVERLRGELAQALEREERLAKDIKNYRRHAEAALASAGREAKEELLSELGETIRDLERAAAAAERDPYAVREGIELVAQSVERMLAAHGMERIPTVNEPFDPSIHEAVATESVPGVARGTVVRELSPGFRAGERVVRPARVSVAG